AGRARARVPLNQGWAVGGRSHRRRRRRMRPVDLGRRDLRSLRDAGPKRPDGPALLCRCASGSWDDVAMDRTRTLVSGEEIMNLAGPGAFSRGSRYAEQGHVLRVVWHDSDLELVGDVAGSTGLYRTTVGFEDGEPGEVVFAECTCPVGTDCKHCVATLLVNNERVVEGSIP